MSLYRRCLSARDKLDVVVLFIYYICNKIKKKRKQITLRNVPYFAKKISFLVNLVLLQKVHFS
jgi:hypothetical protein